MYSADLELTARPSMTLRLEILRLCLLSAEVPGLHCQLVSCRAENRSPLIGQGFDGLRASLTLSFEIEHHG